MRFLWDISVPRLIYVLLGVGHGGQPNTAYSFWSGFGSCLAYFGLPLAVYKKHNCHVHRCWRMAHHDITGPDGITYKVCHVHRGRSRRFTLKHLEATLLHHDLRTAQES